MGGKRVLLETMRRNGQEVEIKPSFYIISEVRGRESFKKWIPVLTIFRRSVKIRTRKCQWDVVKAG